MTTSPTRPTDMTFAHELKGERLKRGWTQAKLAEELGIEPKTIYRWERGDFLPVTSLREKVSELLERSLKDLGLLEGPESPRFILDPMIPLLPLYQLIGREEQLASLKATLRKGGNIALSALNGLPGVGKTAISIALAYDVELRQHFADGILWAGLGPSPNVQSHLSRWANLLGIPSSDLSRLKTQDEWSIAVHRAIGGRRMLLVIDDAWTSEAALALKVGGATCSHLITTRFPPLANLVAGQGSVVLKELTMKQGLDLLSRLAPQVVEQEPEAARSLVEAVGALPLALVLMGNYLRSQTYMGPSRRIKRSLQRLRDAEARLTLQEARAPSERHPSQPHDDQVSLKTIIAITDQQLSKLSSQAFYALSTFPAKPNSFSEEAALAVANCQTDTLDELSDAGLLQNGGSDRYTLHHTIADYARLQLTEHGAYDRFIEYMTRYVEMHSLDYELLEIEIGNVFAALEAAFEFSHAYLARLCVAFSPFLLARGLYQVAERHLQRAYDTALREANQLEQVEVLLQLGKVIKRTGNFPQAEHYLQEGLQLARQRNVALKIPDFLSDLGSLAWKQGKYPEAEEYLLEGLPLARRDNDQSLYLILLTLSSLELRRGNSILAETYAKEALTLYRKNDLAFDRAEMSLLLGSLGSALMGQNRLEEAQQAYLEALEQAREISHSEWIANILNNLAELHKLQGNYVQAEEYFREGLERARQINHREWICVLLVGCGEVARRQGRFDLAQNYLNEGIKIAKAVGIPQMIALGLSELGQIALLKDAQNVDLAEQIFHEMKTFVPADDRELQSWLYYDLALLARGRGNLTEAYRLASLAEEHKTVASASQVTDLLAALAAQRASEGEA